MAERIRLIKINDSEIQKLRDNARKNAKSRLKRMFNKSLDDFNEGNKRGAISGMRRTIAFAQEIDGRGIAEIGFRYLLEMNLALMGMMNDFEEEKSRNLICLLDEKLKKAKELWEKNEWGGAMQKYKECALIGMMIAEPNQELTVYALDLTELESLVLFKTIISEFEEKTGHKTKIIDLTLNGMENEAYAELKKIEKALDGDNLKECGFEIQIIKETIEYNYRLRAVENFKKYFFILQCLESKEMLDIFGGLNLLGGPQLKSSDTHSPVEDFFY
ncbi:hypothetical protein JXB01_01685 [Candidatus Micrarchaeota archaeon]|nr:hypothetical protein [Candidatus Micrarchaeota archaeon]